MGTVHSEPNQAGCVTWQNSNPTKDCTWTEGCIQYWIAKKGEQPVSENTCIINSAEESSPRYLSRRKRNNDILALILISASFLLLALMCLKKK